MGIKITTVAEDASWEPEKHARKVAQSTQVLKEMKVGDCKRIIHHDLQCDEDGCSLGNAISKLRKKGWVLEYYHEGYGVAVVRRLK